jgi:superfamily II DNA or RNA helicase
MPDAFRGLRRFARFAPPQTTDWAANDSDWERLGTVLSAVPPFAEIRVSEDLVLTMDSIACGDATEISRPAILEVACQFGDLDCHDCAFDLLTPLVEVVTLLQPLGSPTTAGSVFVKDESTVTARGQTRSRTSIRPLGIPKEVNPKEPKGYDVFAMLLPILMPPATSEFREELLFPAELYPFQRAGVKWLFENEDALLADDMGLGKTVQAITAFRALVRRGMAMQALVVCPKSVLTNWLHELDRWAPELVASRVQGPVDQRRVTWQAYIGKCHVLVTTYDTVRQDSAVIRGRPFDVVIADEIQRIKNPSTATSQAVRSLPAKKKWGLTGTPLENSAEDVAGIFSFIRPGLFRLGQTQVLSASTIRDRIRPFVLRRRKQEVLPDLPPVVVDTKLLELTESQRRTYDQAEDEGVIRLKNSQNLTLQHVFALIGALKQICNFDPDTGDSCKVEYLLEEFLPEACTENQKALVVSQYVESLSEIGSQIAEYSPITFTGSLSLPQRDAVLRDFESNDDRKVLLLSLRAGGVGLNLARANYVLHFDRWWNPAIEDQATARVHRIGQTRSVFVSRIVCQGTIEERIERLLERKRVLFSQVVDELSDVGLEQVFSEEELFGLFGLEPPRRRASDAQAAPTASQRAIVISPSTPYSNVVHLREVLRESEEFLYWADLHFHARALEEIAAAIDPARVRVIRILSGSANVDDKATRDFKRFVEEMTNKGISAEWRVLEHFSHDRYIISKNACFNVPPVNSLLQGSYSEVMETPNRPPFADWWQSARRLN